MDPAAYLYESRFHRKPNYSSVIRRFCIGEGNTPGVYAAVISFFEMMPRQDNLVWVEAMPGDSVLRCNVLKSGPVPREELDTLFQKIQTTLDVRATYPKEAP